MKAPVRDAVAAQLMSNDPEAYERLHIPIGYLVPLHDEGMAPHSYVFASTGWLPHETVMETLPADVVGFTGHEVPWRPAEVLRISLDKVGMKRLPTDLYLRDLIQRYNWSKPDCNRMGAEFESHYGDSGYFCGMFANTLMFHEGARPNNPVGLPEGPGAFWREGRATIWVELDGAHRSFHFSVMRAMLHNFIQAFGGLGEERLILEGFGHEFLNGRFLSPEESRDRFQAASMDALGHLGQHYFANSVAGPRWPEVREALYERADTSGLPPRAEWEHATQSSMKLALHEEFEKVVGPFVADLLNGPPFTRDGLKHRLTKLQDDLVAAIRAPLNNAVTEDFLLPEWRKKHPDPEIDRTQPEEPERSDDEILADTFGRELLTRANLTPQEKRVLAAIAQPGPYETLAGWARKQGISPATANVHKSNAKAKLERAKKLP